MSRTVIERGGTLGLKLSEMREIVRALRLITQEDESAEVNISAAERAAKAGALEKVENALSMAQARPSVCECGHHKTHHATGKCGWSSFDYGARVCGCKRFKPEGDFTIHSEMDRRVACQ